MSNRSAARGTAAASSMRLTLRTSNAVATSNASPSRCFLFCEGSRAARSARTAAATVSTPPISKAPPNQRRSPPITSTFQAARGSDGCQGGCTVVNVNPLYTARELAHQVNDAGARVLFVGETFGHTVEEAAARLKLDEIIVVTPGDLMGLKGAMVDLMARRVKKAVQPFHLPKAETFSSVLAT